MKIADIISLLEAWAPPALQESYDNAGLLTGNYQAECSGVLVCLDAVEQVVEEAIEKNCNLIVAHHPIIFRGLKSITGKNYVERVIIRAIRNDIAIYAIHTNLDNVISGVSGRMAQRLGLLNTSILAPREATLKKLYTYVPDAHLEAVRSALFEAGGGQIGHYSECSFVTGGTGSFRGNAASNPFVGNRGERHYEAEQKLELVFPAWSESALLAALRQAHPYEEVAYEIITLDNKLQTAGSGIVGELPEALSAQAFLQKLGTAFETACIRHTSLPDRPIQKVALCGGAGSFLVSRALSVGAEAYVSADFKYHEFFEADNRMLICDLGHYESEQFTIDLLKEKIAEKFPTFAVLKTGVNTNPVSYSCP